MTVYSITPFFNELDTLEIKLAEQYDEVDIFVIAEAGFTYAGTPKPFHFEENRERFKPWSDKIRYIKVRSVAFGGQEINPSSFFQPTNSIRWKRERYQRDQLKQGLYDLQDDDIVHIADLDEIVAAKSFEDILHQWHLSGEEFIQPSLSMHVMYMNWRWHEPYPVVARFCTGRTLKKYGIEHCTRTKSNIHILQDNKHPSKYGWHLSYLGGSESIRYKIKEAAHSELSVPEYTDIKKIEARMAKGLDLFGRPDRNCEYIGIYDLPLYVQENREKFSHLLLEKNPEYA